MKIRDLSVWEGFLRVAQDQSFVVAAKKLNIGPPLLTKKIQALEAELGVRLFQRTTRKVSLTQDGLAILPRVKAFLEDGRNIENQFESKAELSGLIRISSITAFTHRVLADLILKFRKLHPQVNFEVDPNDRYVDLIDSQFDLAIRVDEPKGADFIYKRLIDNHLVVCASPKYIKENRVALHHPNDLKKYAMLTLDVYKDCRFIKTQIPIGYFFESKQISSESGLLLTDLALKGAGITIRSYWDVKPFIDQGKLVRLLSNHPIEHFGTIYAVMTGNRLLARRVRVFMDFLEQEMKVISGN